MLVVQTERNLMAEQPQGVRRSEKVRGKDITGCEFSVAQELLVLAKVEENSGIREWDSQKNAEDSVAQHGAKCR